MLTVSGQYNSPSYNKISVTMKLLHYKYPSDRSCIEFLAAKLDTA